jgi:hypothetical protein
MTPHAIPIQEILVPVEGSGPYGIVAGPDGAMTHAVVVLPPKATIVAQPPQPQCSAPDRSHSTEPP